MRFGTYSSVKYSQLTSVPGIGGVITLLHLLLNPSVSFGFMRHALIVCLELLLHAATLGVFLLLRRMSLVSNELSYAVLPGVAIGYLISGISLVVMGLVVYFWIDRSDVVRFDQSRPTRLKEDVSFADFYFSSSRAGRRAGIITWFKL